MEHTLQAEKREETGSKAAARLRAAKKIPAILYGAGEASQQLTLDTTEFMKVWQEAGESSTVTLSTPEGKKIVLIQDIELDPLYQTPLHADLLAVKADQAVEVTVPLTFSGVAPAEKELGGSLVKVMHELDVEAFPQDLPHEISVDVSTLATFEDQIHVRDIVLPKGVIALAEADEVVALVKEAREEVVEEGVAAVDLASVEVEKKGKEETEDTRTE